MNYELAKKLKDAGFPFEYGYCIDEPKEDWTGHPECAPTLSELIEACDKTIPKGEWDDFDAHICVSFSESGWIAGYLRFEMFEGGGFDSEPRGTGQTPEEAVANLWLVLNSK